MGQTRRSFLKSSGVGLLTFYVGGCEQEMTPEAAREMDVPHRILTAGEVATLDALGDTLLPGAAAAGLSHFIDHQLGASVEDTMLMIKYLGVPAPFAPFYQGGLAALDGHARAQTQAAFADLDAGARKELVGGIAGTNPDGWQGPPAPFFYFVLRSDAVDVVYGTKAGVESLDIPYMAHIEPPSRWGE